MYLTIYAQIHKHIESLNTVSRRGWAREQLNYDCGIVEIKIDK